MVLLLQVRCEKKFLHSESIGQCSARSRLSREPLMSPAENGAFLSLTPPGPAETISDCNSD